MQKTLNSLKKMKIQINKAKHEKGWKMKQSNNKIVGV